MKTVVRSRLVLLAQFAQTILFGVLIGTVFLNIGNDQEGQKKRLPVLFFVCINQGVFSALILINSCTTTLSCYSCNLFSPPDSSIRTTDCASRKGVWNVLRIGLLCSQDVCGNDSPVRLPSRLFVHRVLPRWPAGAPAVHLICISSLSLPNGYCLQTDAGKFFIFVGFMELCSLTATSLALMISTFCRTVTLSITVLPLVLEVGIAVFHPVHHALICFPSPS